MRPSMAVLAILLAASCEAPTEKTPSSTSSTPSTLSAGRSYTESAANANIEMVWIPGGPFTMYSETVEGFWIGKYEVTQGQWQAVMGSNPSSFKGSDRLPVENVDWNDAMEFCRKLSGLSGGKAYTLPTELEWEFACRAGSKTAYYFGDSES